MVDYLLPPRLGDLANRALSVSERRYRCLCILAKGYVRYEELRLKTKARLSTELEFVSNRCDCVAASVARIANGRRGS